MEKLRLREAGDFLKFTHSSQDPVTPGSMLGVELEGLGHSACYFSDTEACSRRDFPRSLPGVNVTASLALGNLQIWHSSQLHPGPFLFPVHSPPAPSLQSMPELKSPPMLGTLTFLSYLFPGPVCVGHCAGLG